MVRKVSRQQFVQEFPVVVPHPSVPLVCQAAPGESPAILWTNRSLSSPSGLGCQLHSLREHTFKGSHPAENHTDLIGPTGQGPTTSIPSSWSPATQQESGQPRQTRYCQRELRDSRNDTPANHPPFDWNNSAGHNTKDSLPEDSGPGEIKVPS